MRLFKKFSTIIYKIQSNGTSRCLLSHIKFVVILEFRIIVLNATCDFVAFHHSVNGQKSARSGVSDRISSPN